jgi:hypothetical protein
MTRGIYPARLRNGNRPGPWPPNALLATPLAAKLLGVSVRQMERWRGFGIGPVHEPRGKWRGNVVRYQLAHLLAFRNRVLRSGPGTYQGVWSEWMEENRPMIGILMRDPWPPPKLTRAWRRGGIS